VFGFLGNHRVRGVIDEIAELPDPQAEHGPADKSPRKNKLKVMRRKRFGISDLKTRVEATLPEDRRTRAARMQLSVYHQLLSAMVDGDVDMNRLYTELDQRDPSTRCGQLNVACSPGGLTENLEHVGYL